MNKPHWLVAVPSFLALALLAGPARAAAPPDWCGRTVAESLEAIDRLVVGSVDPAGPGAAVVVMRGGKVVFQKGYGLADLDKKTPITTTTTFELASVSKPFTSFAILILAERGELALDDDVRKYVPELPVYDKKRPIRITDLLQHTSGLPEHLGWREVAGFSSRTTADFVKMTAESKLKFPTGTQWSYSNANFRMLAVIVERVSGKGLPTFLKDEVFDPLGMKHTFVREERKPAAKGRAVGYMPGIGLISALKYQRMNTEFVLVGEAGVWSCVEDLALFERELRRPTLVTRASLRRAWTAGKLDNGKPINYGLGWVVAATPSGRKLSHSGGWPGFNTYFLRYPERDLAVIVLRNIAGRVEGNAIALAERSGNLMLEAQPRHGWVKLTEADMKAVAGTYQREGKDGPKELEITRRADGPYLVLAGQRPFPLRAASRTHFRVEGAGGLCIALEWEGPAIRELRLENRAGKVLGTFHPRKKPAQ